MLRTRAVVPAVVLAVSGLALAGELGVVSEVRMSVTRGTDTVTRVVDGDTIETSGFKQTNIRILGINTPETKDPRRGVECGGPEASAFAAKELRVGTSVRLVVDPTQGASDKYGRPLRYVEYFKDGRWVDFSTQSARFGHADVYVFQGKPVVRDKQIREAMAKAQQDRLGKWGRCPVSVVPKR